MVAVSGSSEVSLCSNAMAKYWRSLGLLMSHKNEGLSWQHTIHTRLFKACFPLSSSSASLALRGGTLDVRPTLRTELSLMNEVYRLSKFSRGTPLHASALSRSPHPLGIRVIRPQSAGRVIANIAPPPMLHIPVHANRYIGIAKCNVEQNTLGWSTARALREDLRRPRAARKRCRIWQLSQHIGPCLDGCPRHCVFGRLELTPTFPCPGPVQDTPFRFHPAP